MKIWKLFFKFSLPFYVMFALIFIWIRKIRNKCSFKRIKFFNEKLRYDSSVWLLLDVPKWSTLIALIFIWIRKIINKFSLNMISFFNLNILNSHYHNNHTLESYLSFSLKNLILFKMHNFFALHLLAISVTCFPKNKTLCFNNCWFKFSFRSILAEKTG